MADNTKIEWTDATWNPITGCSVISPGCTNCYAMKLAGTRMKHHPSRAGLTVDSKAGPVWNGQVRFNEEWLTQPLTWKRPRMIFVCAHADLFHESVSDEWIDRVFAVMALAPQHTFQVLTKRSKRMREYFGKVRHEGGLCDSMSIIWQRAQEIAIDHSLLHRYQPKISVLPNVWLGVSIEDQKRADERIPDLLATPAAVRWLSMEPLLGAVTLNRATVMVSPGVELPVEWVPPLCQLDWVVLGGESGSNARPMHPDWARSIRDQCAAADVPFHFKQWGEFETHYDRQKDDPDWRQCGTVQRLDPKGQWLNLDGGCGFHGERLVRVSPVGKKRAGRLLDGVEHNGYPEPR